MDAPTPTAEQIAEAEAWLERNPHRTETPKSLATRMMYWDDTPSASVEAIAIQRDNAAAERRGERRP